VSPTLPRLVVEDHHRYPTVPSGFKTFE
jgi:hypothetical protein